MYCGNTFLGWKGSPYYHIYSGGLEGTWAVDGFDGLKLGQQAGFGKAKACEMDEKFTCDKVVPINTVSQLLL